MYNNLVENNTANGNGAAGLLAAAGGSGSAVYNNTFSGNTAIGNGLAGMTLHSHAPLQDINGNVVTGNNFSNDALHGGPGGGPGDVEGPPASANLTQTAGVQVLSVFAPLTGTVIQGNTITNVFYGIWQSALASSSAISGNNISVTAGGTPVFTVPAAGRRVLDVGGRRRGVQLRGQRLLRRGAGLMSALPTVGIARHRPTAAATGWWLGSGNVLPFGDATSYGSTQGKPLNAPIVGYGRHPGRRRLLAGRLRRRFVRFGDATFMGSMGGSISTRPSWGSPPLRRGVGTGWWPATAASSPSATPSSSGPWAASASTSRSSASPRRPDR